METTNIVKKTNNVECWLFHYLASSVFEPRSKAKVYCLGILYRLSGVKSWTPDLIRGL